MASTFEQQSVRRKFIYFGLILLLFTVSLLHRKLLINAQANELQLRDVGRGKADLTDAAFRLTLSGARGVAVTSLWLAAIERQKRHEWNELELAVDSLTRLQPHFTAPWYFQGWNLAFNVAVECDRVRDKYYYVSRGIALLCRGEEKNDPGQAVPPQPWPANPDMRFQIANTYHRKIGQSDENKTMRCLFDLSCTPLAERIPELFYMAGRQGKQLNLARFKLFCESRPRLVRRLRERLNGFERPEAIVQFLADNKDIPGRIEDRSRLEDDQRLAEFPILPPLPPPDKAGELCPYPDWRNEALATSGEDFDVFTCMRAWDTYAQIPLPPPGTSPANLDLLKYRLPRVTTVVIRSYPARSQVFFAEELQKDGWFDGSGWAIAGWFVPLTATGDVIAGTGPKYNSGEAWRRAYDLYLDFGHRNGFFPEENRDGGKSGGTADDPRKRLESQRGRDVTNFDNLFNQTKVEKTPEAVAARMAIFEVEHTEAANPNVVSIYREKVLPQWLDLLLRNSEFRHIDTVQEETYELQTKYFKLLQYYNRASFETLVKEAALMVPTWPTWPLPGAMPPPADYQGHPGKFQPQAILKFAMEKRGIKVLPIRDVEGLFDQLFVLEGPKVEALKPLAMVLARNSVWPPPPMDPKAPDVALARFVIWPPPPGNSDAVPEIGLGLQAAWPPPKGFLSQESVAGLAGLGVGAAWRAPIFMLLSSAEQRRILTQVASQRRPPSGQGWRPLVPPQAIRQVRQQVRWLRPPVDLPP